MADVVLEDARFEAAEATVILDASADVLGSASSEADTLVNSAE